jgi:hypothetical protein
MPRLRHLSALALLLSWLAAPAFAHTPTPSPPAADDPRDVNLRTYAELLRTDVRKQKVAILTELLDLTDAEDAVFWPIYREYDVELAKINDERVALIAEYANSYEQLTDDAADRLARGALDVQARRQALLSTYYERVESALSPKPAARFLQVEHQLLLIIDLQISAALPVVK